MVSLVSLVKVWAERTHCHFYCAGVHDCFWTHAATADDMGAILRDKFVELHSRPLLEELVQDFKRSAPTLEPLPPLPQKGFLDLHVVRNAPYFFS